MNKLTLRKIIREEISKVLGETTSLNPSDEKRYFSNLSDSEKKFAISVITLLTNRKDFNSLFDGGFSFYALEQKFKDITRGKYGIADIMKKHIAWNPVKLANVIFDLIKKYNEANP